MRRILLFLCSTIFVASSIILLMITNFDKTSNDLSNEDITELFQTTFEAYCVAIYYSDLAVTVGPEDVTYEAYQEIMEEALNHWELVEAYSEILMDNIGLDSFVDENQSSLNGLFNGNTAYAAKKDYQDIVEVFKNARHGNRIKAVAEFLNTDSKYAYEQFKQAERAMTTEVWLDQAEREEINEQAARTVRMASKNIVLVGGTIAYASTGQGQFLPALGITVMYADTLISNTDDGAFILLGSREYDSNPYVQTFLLDTKDTFGLISQPIGLLTMGGGNDLDKGLRLITLADTAVSVGQTGKFSVLDFSSLMRGKDGKLYVKTPEEMLEMVRENDIDEEFEALLNELEEIAEEQDMALETYLEQVIAETDTMMEEVEQELEQAMEEIEASIPGELFVEVSNYEPMVGDNITFKVSGGASGYTYRYDFGDGESRTGGAEVNHSYDIMNTYSITITAYDEDGDVYDVIYTEVTVNEEVGDLVRLSGSYIVVEGYTMEVENEGSTDYQLLTGLTGLETASISTSGGLSIHGSQYFEFDHGPSLTETYGSITISGQIYDFIDVYNAISRGEDTFEDEVLGTATIDAFYQKDYYVGDDLDNQQAASISSEYEIYIKYVTIDTLGDSWRLILEEINPNTSSDGYELVDKLGFIIDID